MISLIGLLKEMTSSPKAIIMAGGASVGKSTILKSLEPILKNFTNLNADNYVEDKNSPLYNNLAAASSKIRKEDLPNAINNKQNIIYDTTASNLKNMVPIFDELKDAGYETIMIMVYAHPIISFLRNFKRERKVPAVGVLGTWVNTYNLIEDYKNIFGDKFILVVTPPSTIEEKQAIENFNLALKKGKLSSFFENLLSTGEFASTFRKNIDFSTLSPDDIKKLEASKEKTKKNLDVNIEKISDTFEQIQKNINPINSQELPSILKNFIK